MLQLISFRAQLLLGRGLVVHRLIDPGGVKTSHFGLAYELTALYRVKRPTIVQFLVMKSIHLGKDNVHPNVSRLRFFVCVFQK